jgi:hypothetical protein
VISNQFKNERRFIKRMKKLLVSAFLLGVILFGVVGVVADTDTFDIPVTGELEEALVIEILPASLDFGSIPNTDTLEKAGSTVTIDTAGSDTASDGVFVEITTSGTDKDFFDALLEFDLDGVPTWTDITDIPTLEIAEGDLMSMPTRLSGDSTVFGVGAKSALITYTISGTPPTP